MKLNEFQGFFFWEIPSANCTKTQKAHNFRKRRLKGTDAPQEGVYSGVKYPKEQLSYNALLLEPIYDTMLRTNSSVITFEVAGFSSSVYIREILP